MSARADDLSEQTFNVKSAQLLQAFYHDTSTVSRLNATTAIGSAKTYRCDVVGSQSGVDGDERMWTRSLNLIVFAYPNSVAT